MRRGCRTESRASREARREFTEIVLARGACEIQELIPHVCSGWWDACHYLPKQFIKRETNLWAEQEALAAIWDPDNGGRGCRTGHDLLDSPGHGGVEWWQLPSQAIEFCERHGWLWKLELIYPAAEEIAA